MLAVRALVLVLLVSPAVALAQDLEPRRWTHMPVGSNVVGATYAYSAGDITFDPVLEIDNATVEANTLVAAYVRSFELLGTTARLDALLPYTSARWKGLLSGQPASRSQTGLSDPWVRFSVNLLGSPPLSGKDYLAYRAERPVRTIVGLALSVGLPLGVYDSSKLLNIGLNRFTFRPQAGVVHYRGRWSFELTGSVFVYTDNTDFFGGNTLSQDPLWALQGHVIHTWDSQWWLGLGLGYSKGGESQLNGEYNQDKRSGLLGAISFGLPITRTQGLKFAYMRGDTLVRVGGDLHTFFLTWKMLF